MHLMEIQTSHNLYNYFYKPLQNAKFTIVMSRRKRYLIQYYIE